MNLDRSIVAAVALAGFVAARPAATGNTWRVGTTRSFATIQGAVDAAVDGDLILVDAGAYPPFVVDGKGLAIVADVPGLAFSVLPSPTVPAVTIRNLGVDRSVTIRDFTTPVQFGGTAALSIANCVGTVSVESAVLDPQIDLVGVPMSAVVEIVNCSAVFLRDGRIESTIHRNGSTTNGVSAPGGTDRGIAAVHAHDSRLVLERCSLLGYDNLGTPASGRYGGDAVRLTGTCELRIDDPPTYLTGGDGSEFGGNAIHAIAQRLPNVRACNLNSGSYTKGLGSNPGGYFAHNHDRGLSSGAERYIENCLFESLCYVRGPSHLRIGTATTISVTSPFQRSFWLFVGPPGYERVRGIENTGFLQLSSPWFALFAAGATSPFGAPVALSIPATPGLVGLQFSLQALVDAPLGQVVPPWSFSLEQQVLILP